MADVIGFRPELVGEGYRFEPDKILEEAKGQDFTNIVVVGEMPDGSIWVSSAANAGEALVMMERAKHFIVFGKEPE